MNSNHLTLYSRYEEETEWNVTQGKYNHIKKEAQTAISTTHESLTKPHAFTLLFQKTDMFPKIIHHPMGSNPHLLKQMHIYT